MIYRYVYGRWDGTQQLFPFDADDLMASLSDELIADGDLMRALQRMMRQGDQGKLDDRMPGLQQLMERGVWALPAGLNVLRLLPPLVIEQADLERVVEVIGEVLE